MGLVRCGAMYSDEEDSAESTTDEDNLEDNTSQDATDERYVVTYVIFAPCVMHIFITGTTILWPFF